MPESQPTKSVLSSKTIIFNVLTIATLLLGSPEFLDFLPPMTAEQVGSILAGINIALRFVTKGPVSVTGA